MNAKLSYWISSLTAFPLALLAVPYGAAHSPTADQTTYPLQQMRSQLLAFKYEVQNHESEIKMLEEKLNAQENAFAQLREQLEEQLKEQVIKQKEKQKEDAELFSTLLTRQTEETNETQKSFELLSKKVASDLQQIKTQANDSVVTLGQHKKKIGEIEHLLALQSQQIQSLEAALNSVLEVLQIKDLKESEQKLKTYKVQPGDSLDKIARLHHCSIQAIQEANHLTSDKIVAGQLLKIP